MKLKETEGTPTVQSEEYWMKEFRKQRKDRLQDAVDEYMQDGEINDFYNDLTDAIQSLIDYHEKQKGYAVTAMKAISGHRPLQQEYNLREAEYYNKRAQLDMGYQPNDYYWDKDRNKSYVAADGYSHKDIPDRY